MIQPKDETEGLLLSITKNCETLIKQTHTKPQEVLEFILDKSRETFHFKPSFQIDDVSWMVGLISLEIYNSIFNITEQNKKFELYTDPFHEFSFEELKDELEEILSTSNITPYHLQHAKIGPRNIEAYRKLRLEKSSSDGFIKLLMGNARSPFRDFEKYLRIVIGLNEGDIQLILKQYISNFVSFVLKP